MKMNYTLVLPVVAIAVILVANIHLPTSHDGDGTSTTNGLFMPPAVRTGKSSDVKSMVVILKSDLKWYRNKKAPSHYGCVDSYNSIASQVDHATLAKFDLPDHL